MGAGYIDYIEFEHFNMTMGSGSETLTIESTHAGATNIDAADGGDTFNVETISGHTTLELGTGADEVNVSNDAGTVDSIGALLTVSGDAGGDTINILDGGEAGDNLGTLTESTLIGLDMTAEADVNHVQTITVDPLGGDFTVQMIDQTTGQAFVQLEDVDDELVPVLDANGNPIDSVTLAADATEEEIRIALQEFLGGFLTVVFNGVPLSAFTENVNVRRFGDVIVVRLEGAFRGAEGQNVRFVSADTHVQIATRNEGINYYGIETLNLDLGSGDDRLNIQGTSAVTNVDAGAGDDLIYVSSGANLGLLGTYAAADGSLENLHDAVLHGDRLDPVSGDLFQAGGTLDFVSGDLNIDAGAGENTLSLSDRHDPDADTAVTVTDSSITGLADGDITYGATTGSFSGQGTWAQSGDWGLFGIGISVYAGSGNNTIDITSVSDSGIVNAPFSRTVTQVFAGGGSDTVNVAVTESLGRYLVVQGEAGNDTIDASLSTVPVVLFGNEGGDTLTGGPMSDLLFGDSGRITFIRPTSAGPGLDVVLGAPADASDLAGLSFDDDSSTADLFVSVLGDSDNVDRIIAAGGNDVVVGGGNDGADINDLLDVEEIDAGEGDNTVLGDSGLIHLVNALLTEIRSFDAADGGRDDITAGSGFDVVIGGAGADKLTAGEGSNIIVGDSGRAVLTANQLELVESIEPAVGGSDTITTGTGSDYIIGGADGDVITTNDGLKVIVGDGGRVVLDGTDIALVETISPGVGGVDTITTMGTTARNIAIGGALGDLITLSNGDNTVVGDDGRAVFQGGILTLVESIVTVDANGLVQTGGVDTITGGAGPDNIIGGQAGDIIQAGNGRNIVMGDSGRFLYELDGDLSLAETDFSSDGGIDDIDSGSGNDVLLGGAAGDLLDAAGGDNVVLGDSGRITFLDGIVDDVASVDEGVGGVDYIDTSGTGRDVIVGGAAGDFINTGDGQKVVLGDSGVIDLVPTVVNGEQAIVSVASTAQGVGGVDRITTSGTTFRNIVIGGAFGDFITVGNGENTVLGDEGRAVFLNNILSIVESIVTLDGNNVPIQNGGVDEITGGEGADNIIGGQAADTILAGNGRNIVMGDSGSFTYEVDGDLAIAETVHSADGGVDTITSGTGSDVLLGGAVGDMLEAGEGDNVVLGDSGRITFLDGIVDDVVSVDEGIGGQDDIDTTGTGRDVIVGGADDDTIHTGDGQKVILGDSGSIDLDPFVMNGEQDLISIRTTAPGVGGVDTITSGAGTNTILGGPDGDIINAGSLGDNVVLGDNGEAFWVNGILDLIRSTDEGDGGIDVIIAGSGADKIIGGQDADQIVAGAGDNFVIGDSGELDFDAAGILATARTTAPGIGGVDDITTGPDDDVLFGGASGDTIGAGDGHNVVFGDEGIATFTGGILLRIESVVTLDAGGVTQTGGIDTITTGAGRDDVVGGQAGDVITVSDGENVVLGDSGVLDYVGGVLVFADTTEPGDGGVDVITSGVDRDVVFGGTAGDTINANAGDNVLVGDDGEVTFTAAGALDLIESTEFSDGDVDTITSLGGADHIIGGHEGDIIDAGDGWNVVAGDSARVDYEAGTLVRIETLASLIGGVDTIMTGLGSDVVLGGIGGDLITVNVGETAAQPDSSNVVVGDSGSIDYTSDDADASDIDEILSTETGDGGSDTITTGAGSDIVIGGAAGDVIVAGAGDNVVFGDSARILAATQDLSTTLPITAGLLETITPGVGGIDQITTLGGRDIVLGGHEGDTINAGEGDNIVLGDDGRIDTVRGERSPLDDGADTDASDIDLIESTSTTAAGGIDIITTGAGNDLMIGGRFGDTITAGAGDNLVVGDSARMTSASADAPQLLGLSITFGLVETIAFGDGGVDIITTLFGRDILFGGHEGDVINAGEGANIVVGDDGLIDYVRGERSAVGTPGADLDASDIDLIQSTSTIAAGGVDVIDTGVNDDIVFGGRFGDTLRAGEGRNLVFGDSGQITAANLGTPQYAGHALTFGLLETIEPSDGGVDAITSGSGTDIALGGHDGDTINAGEGDNLVVGDDGFVDFTRADRGLGGDADAADIDLIESTSTTFNGGVDVINTGAGNDLVIGGRLGDTITSGAGDNVVIGDSGRIVSAVADLPRLTDHLFTLGLVETIAFDDGGIDLITVLGGMDVVLGGDEGDTIDAGEGANVVLGDDGSVDYDLDGNPADIDEITSLSTTLGGGADVIDTGSGSDVVIGGRFADDIEARAGDNVVIGDSGRIVSAVADAPQLVGLPMTLGLIETIAFGDGGVDIISTLTGRDIVLGGDEGDTIDAGEGDNVVLGDDGLVDYDLDGNPADIDEITSLSTTLGGGADFIDTGSGSDVVIGGRFADNIEARAGDNVVIGDSGRIVSAVSDALQQLSGLSMTLGLIETIAFGDGGVDIITTLFGRDIVFGGHEGDVINAGDGANIVVGDDGLIDYVRGERSAVGTPGADLDASDIDLIQSTSTIAAGGVDVIDTGVDDDIVLGGRFGDTLRVGEGRNLVFGDSGQITAANAGAPQYAGHVVTFGLLETIEPSDGGADMITSGSGTDIALGGQDGDTIDAGEGDNLVVGDDGFVDFTRADRSLGGDADASDIDLIESTSTTLNGGVDIIDTGAGNDLVIGGRLGDTIRSGAGDNVVIGDSGRIVSAVADLPRLTDHLFTLGLVETTAFDDGGIDTITTLGGRDVVLGGDEGDTIDAGEGANVVLGDDGSVNYDLDGNPADIDEITSLSTTLGGGADVIDTGSGSDVVIGGRFADDIEARAGDNLVIGDSGRIVSAVSDALQQLSGLPMTLGLIETIAFGDGGVDIITTLTGRDIVFGGHEGDAVDAGDGANIVVGDDGLIDYVRGERAAAGTPGADLDASDIDLIQSTSTTAAGGVDVIDTGAGNDIVFGGRFGDTLRAGEGRNLVFGDSGQITAANTGAPQYAGHVLTFGLLETVEASDGGADTITSGSGTDIALGGHDGDTINAGEGDNLVVGDDGFVDFTRADRGLGGDADATDIDLIESTSTTANGGVDFIDTGAGNDLVIGGRFGDDIEARAGDNVVIGDSGRIVSAVADLPRLTDHLFTLGLVETIAFDDSGADTITTGSGHSIVMGGVGVDSLSSGNGSHNIIFGDNGFVDFAQDGDLSTVDVAYTIDHSSGDADIIISGDGNDIIFGGAFGDTIWAGAGNDLVLGDFGRLDSAAGSIDASQLPLSMPVGTHPFTFTSTDTQNAAAGDDLIFGEEGEDILLGQQGSDTIYGGADDDDIIGGHNVSLGHDGADRLDGGSGDDVIAGDNASILRRGDSLDPRIRVLSGTEIYGETLPDDARALVTPDSQVNPRGTASRQIEILDHADDTDPSLFGGDYIAGGADDDLIFGQLGDDIVQGDGSIDLNGNGLVDLDGSDAGVVDVNAARLGDGTLAVRPSVESASDGDDYIEGGGGDDTVFGNLGQDDIIGGSSTLFGLDTPAERPDGSDLIFGGAATDIGRNDTGDTSSQGHARDSDAIAGDNANLLLLVGTGTIHSGAFLEFNYDQTSAFEDRGTLRIVPRAIQYVDYTPGGADFDAASAAGDIGAADEVHGESGDDFIYGFVGNDILFGDGQDDDIVGGYGHDWISGGTGQDGVLGDDGRIYTQRNSSSEGEPLYGLGPVQVNSSIDTPGNWQQADIYPSGELLKSVNLAPFSLGADPQQADDIIFGGWGSDFLHAGDGDDAVSGAEALEEFFDAPENAGNVLRYGEDRAGEFAAYDEFNPRHLIQVDETGAFIEVGSGDTGSNFILNFDAQEAPTGSTGIADDGADFIFGDLGNDWLVGGSGKDRIFGGMGDDLMNVDDDHGTNGGLNDAPDTDPSYEDIAYGGGGRDVLIGNTGGDRLIDWAGEFNSYIVPFAPFGLGTVSRAPAPHIQQYLYDLSEASGADQTRAADTGSAESRNGEPEGEIGLVNQQDFAWRDQTGAPDDPQPGNIPGGPRDVLRSADFNSGQAEGFAPDSGTWSIESGRLRVDPESQSSDAVSVFNLVEVDSLPSYFEIQATINAVKPTGGWKANAYVIFDYYSPTDFKFAGVNISNDKIEMGNVDASGWHVEETDNAQLKPDKDYNVLLSVLGTTVTLVIDNSEVFSHVFAPRVIDGFSYSINAGMIGIGAHEARARIDNVAAQVLPPEITLETTDEFSGGSTDFLGGDATGSWQINGQRFEGTPASGDDIAISLVDLPELEDGGLETASMLEMEATVSTQGAGGFVFDYYSPTDFKFVAITDGAVQIGHHTNRGGLKIDATADWDINPGDDYDLFLEMKGTQVSVSVDGQVVTGFVFNALSVDGRFGVISIGGESSYDEVTVRTDDPAFEAFEPPASKPVVVPAHLVTSYLQLDPSVPFARVVSDGHTNGFSGVRIDGFLFEPEGEDRTDGKRVIGSLFQSRPDLFSPALQDIFAGDETEEDSVDPVDLEAVLAGQDGWTNVPGEADEGRVERAGFEALLERGAQSRFLRWDELSAEE